MGGSCGLKSVCQVWDDPGNDESNSPRSCSFSDLVTNRGNSSSHHESRRHLSANISGFSNQSSSNFQDPKNSESLISGNSTGIRGWRQSECVNYRSLRIRRPRIQALVALPKHSPQYNAVKWALERLGVESVLTFSTEMALHAINNGTSSTPHLVIVDSRHPRTIDPELLARHIRQSSYGENIVIVGVVKKSFIEREEVIVASHLRAGFNRVLLDSGSRGYWMNELVLLLHNDVDTNLQLHCADSLHAALDTCQDIVQITDKQYRVIYENASAQKVLGYTPDELNNKSIWDYQTMCGNSSRESDPAVAPPEGSVEIIQQKLDQGKVWEGSISCRQKSGECIVLDTKVIPVSFSSQRNSDHVVYVRKPPAPSSNGVNNNNVALSNVAHQCRAHNNQRFPKGCESSGSGCGHYQSNRRPSGTMLPVMSIDAPITKIINIILSVQEKSPAPIVNELDKVIEILQATTGATDLFSPELSEDRNKKHADPVAKDLLGALLSQGPKPITVLARSSSIVYRQSIKVRSTSVRGRNSARDALSQRRGSTDPVALSSGSSKNTSGHRTSLPTFDNSPVATRHLLENSSSWEFNIVELEKLTNKRCLVWLGMTVFMRFEIHKTLNCSEATLQNWLTLIEANYNSNISYHNSTHAADVLHAVAYFLESPRVKEYCDGVDEAISLIAAVIHDVDHPGRNSAFLCNSGSELANLYNDITVLENHHASLGFKLTQSDKRVDIFQNLDRDSYKLIRQGVIDMVLATDMSKHFVHVNKFASVFNKMEEVEGSQNSVFPGPPNTPENVAILKRMLIKCADVSNPARPLNICKIWAYRIAEEYFTQTDDEKRLGLTVVMPQFDRATCSIPKSQIGFYDFFINDMFDCLNNFTDFQRLVDTIRINYAYWKRAAVEEGKYAVEEEEDDERISSSKNIPEEVKIIEEDEDKHP